MSWSYLTVWMPTGPSTWSELVLGAVCVLLFPTGIVFVDLEPTWVAAGFLFTVVLFASAVADANSREPAYEDDGLPPIAAPGVVAGVGVLLGVLGDRAGVEALATASGEQLIMGAMPAFVLVVATKTIRVRRRQS